LNNPGPELDPASAVCIGRILSPHGVRGDVKVHPLTDFPERFKAGARVWLHGAPIRIERSRWQGNVVVLKLEGIDDRNAAQGLNGEELFVPEAAPLPDEGVFYQHDILGMTVVDGNGGILGQVTDIFSTGANDVYVVEGDQGQLLLPAIDDVVLDVDVAGRRMTVELMEGLEFQGGTRGRTPRRGGPRRRTTEGGA